MMKATNEILTALIAAFNYLSDVPPGAMTAGRARSLVGVAVSLSSLIIGGLALARGNKRSVAMVAVALGVIGILLSVVHLASFTGGFGTGSGRAGAIVALVLGLIGVSLGGLALNRRRIATGSRETE